MHTHVPSHTCIHTQMYIHNTHTHMYTHTHTERYKDGYNDGCTTVSMSNESNWLHWTIHLKIVKMLNVTWCMSYHKTIKIDSNLKNNSQVSKNFLYKVSLQEPNNNIQRRIWSFVAKREACYVWIWCVQCICVYVYVHSQENTHVPPIQSPLSLFAVLGMQYKKHPCSSSSSSKENNNN